MASGKAALLVHQAVRGMRILDEGRVWQGEDGLLSDFSPQERAGQWEASLNVPSTFVFSPLVQGDQTAVWLP